MKKLFLLITFISIISLFLCSCEPTSIVQKNENIEEELKTALENYSKAEKQLIKLENEINRLQELNKELLIQKTQNTDSIYDSNTLFNWTKNDCWNKIIITDYYTNSNNENTKIIENSQLSMIRPSDFIYGIIKYTEPPDPGAGGIYKYTFFKEAENYSIEIYDNHCFKYNDEFFYCIGNLFMLADSFFPYKKDCLKQTNYLSFIYNSSLILGEKIYLLPIINNKGIKSIINTVDKFNITTTHSETGELLEELSLYNHGEISRISVFENYLNINFREDNIWLESSQEDILPIHILYIFGAN